MWQEIMVKFYKRYILVWHTLCCKAQFMFWISGVKAGTFVRDAKACCPHLVILPYDFEAYEEVYAFLHIDSVIIKLYTSQF